MVEDSNVGISEDEVALYDRQIRLWGLDAQKRLRKAEVLLVRIDGLGAEIAKNLILAGIKSLVILDSDVVTEDDLCAQFLVCDEDLNQNRAKSSVSQAQLLNPMVTVTTDEEDVANKSDEFFTKFDVIIMTNSSREEMIRINDICRKHNIKFFGGNVNGFFGYGFIDLNEHEYVEEIQSVIHVQKSSDDEPSKKIMKETKIVKKSVSFISLRDALNIDWNREQKMIKKLSGSYFVMQCLLEFRSKHGRNPDRLQRESDINKLHLIRDDLFEKMCVNKDKIDEAVFSSVFSQLSPVCAIVGGVLAQEVIKAVSCKDPPHNNFFIFDGLSESGIVERVGK